MRRVLLTVLISIALADALSGGTAKLYAAPPSDTPETCGTTKKHVLDGHSFLPSFAIPAAFSDSTATVALGFGYATLIDPTTSLGQQLKLGAFTPMALGSIAILPPLAINFGVSGNIVAGMNSTSAIRYGASTAYTVKLGAIFEVLRSEKHVLSVALDVDRPHRLSVSPLEAARAGIKDLLGESDPEYVSESVQTTWKPTLRYARSLSPVFGIQSFFGFRFNSTKEGSSRTVDKSRLVVGAGLDADLKPWIRIPLGFSANYVRGQAMSDEISSTNTVTLGVYETVSHLVHVGFEVGRVTSGGLNSTLGALVVKSYYD